MTLGIAPGEHRNGVTFRGGAREWGVGLAWPLTSTAADSLLRAYGGDPPTLMRQIGALVETIDAIPHDYSRLPLTDIRDDGG